VGQKCHKFNLFRFSLFQTLLAELQTLPIFKLKVLRWFVEGVAIQDKVLQQMSAGEVDLKML